MSLSTLLPTILNWVAAILEALFVSSTRSFDGSGGGGGGGGSSNSGADDQHHSHRDPSQLSDDERAVALQEARTCFGLVLEDATDRDKVRRAYKKLSLRHHPDRNSNSPESARMMAKINNHYDILENEIDRLEGTGLHDDGPQMEDEKAEKGKKTPPTRNASNNQTKTKSQRKRERKRQNRARQAAETEREKMEREMRREWEEMKQKRRKVKNEAKKMKRQSNNEAARWDLQSDRGRQQANADWEEAVRRAEEVQRDHEKAEFDERARANAARSAAYASNEGSLHDIDDDNDSNIVLGPSSVSQPMTQQPSNKKAKKAKVAKNPVMDVCTHDIVIYLRLGKSDLAIDEMQEQISERLAHEVARCIVYKRRMPEDEEMECLLRQYLLLSIDDDSNTVLHYGVYFGDAAVLDFVYQMSRKCGAFWKVFLKENRHGHIPLDYSKGRSSIIDPLVRDRVKLLTDMARAEYEDTLFLPSMKKVLGRYCKVASGIDWVQLGNTASSYLVGSRLFQWNPISSLLLCAWAQLDSSVFGKSYRASSGQSRAAFLFALHFFWKLLCVGVYVIGNYFGIGVHVYTIGAPCLILVGRSMAGLQVNGSDDIQISFDKLMNCMMVVTEVLPTPPQLTQKYRLEQCYYVVLLCMFGTGIIKVYNWLSAFEYSSLVSN